jgi:hypothetical protein
MAASQEWKGVAARQAGRADKAQRKVETASQRPDGRIPRRQDRYASTFRDFSLGIARNVPIDNPRKKILSRLSGGLSSRALENEI